MSPDEFLNLLHNTKTNLKRICDHLIEIDETYDTRYSVCDLKVIGLLTKDKAKPEVGFLIEIEEIDND